MQNMKLYSSSNNTHTCCRVLPKYFILLGSVALLSFWALSIWPQEQVHYTPVACPTVVPLPTVASPRPVLEYRGVVESMDGIGFKFKEKKPTLFDPRFDSFYSLPHCDNADWTPALVINIPQIMEIFRECMRAHVDSFKDNVTLIQYQWEKNVTACEEKLDLSQLTIDGFKNQHETKWAVMPKCMENHMMVTFGIGHEVSAETKLNITLPNVTFYGADPIIEPNIQLYSAFGRFFPFAVGKSSGTGRFKVLPNQNQRTREYTYQDVTTIEVIYVLKEIMKVTWIDFFWIDIEGGEMQFLDYFFKGGQFDQHGITICQFNVEMHSDYVENGAQKFYEFVDQLVKDGRYIFMRPGWTGVGVTRLFFLNMEDPKCVKKYFSSS